MQALRGEFGGTKEAGGAGTAWHQFELRAFQVRDDGVAVGKSAQEAEALVPGQRVFIERIRRGGKVIEATADTVIEAGDILAIAGPREVLVELIGRGQRRSTTATCSPSRLRASTSRHQQSSRWKDARGAGDDSGSPRRLPAQDHPGGDRDRHSDPPVHADQPRRHRHPGRTHARHHRRHEGAGCPDRQTDVADVAFIGAAIAIGALIGAVVYKIGSVPLTLSTSGGALISGLFFGWLRSVRPTFGRIPSPTVWFMNSVGLNMFIAVVGISSGPGFVAGLKQLGFSLFFWGVAVTTVPLILAMYVGKYVFRFHPAILLGCCSGARTTTASLGMINDRAKSQIPGSAIRSPTRSATRC